MSSAATLGRRSVPSYCCFHLRLRKRVFQDPGPLHWFFVVCGLRGGPLQHSLGVDTDGEASVGRFVFFTRGIASLQPPTKRMHTHAAQTFAGVLCLLLAVAQAVLGRYWCSTGSGMPVHANGLRAGATTGSGGLTLVILACTETAAAPVVQPAGQHCDMFSCLQRDFLKARQSVDHWPDDRSI